MYMSYICVCMFGWHYLSKATCPMGPKLVHACLVVSRITVMCCMISDILKNTCVRQVALHKWFPPSCVYVCYLTLSLFVC